MEIASFRYSAFAMTECDYTIASDYEISLRWFKNDDQIKKVYLNEWVVKMRLGGKSTTAKLQKIKSTEDLYRLKKQISPIFAHLIRLNISIHRHYTRMDLDLFICAIGIRCHQALSTLGLVYFRL